jgi:peroxiredoxin
MKKQMILGGLCALLFVVSGFVQPVQKYQVGDKAMAFKLKDTAGKTIALGENETAKGFIVVFTCNTCPVAQAYEQRVIDLDKQFASKGYPVIAINANDAQISPGDSYDAMKKRATDKKYSFPYLLDETQEVAKTYGAMHTPTVFVVQKEGPDFIVKYIGAIDNNAQDGAQASEKYVQNAVNALLEGKAIATPTAKAIGCGIKWRKA